MTNKIAIEYLKDMLASAEANLHVPDMAEHAEALDMAIEALEGKDIDVPSRKGVFIPDITVEMFRNASLEGVEELMASGVMEDVSLPSAQPEIIQCKDCKYWEKEGTKGMCNDLYGYGRYWNPDDFCSYAERRTDE